MKSRFFVSALSVAALAATGCAYQGGSGYSHSAYPTTYGSHSAYSAYRPAQTVIGGNRFELDIGVEEFIDGDLIEGSATNETVSYGDAYKRGVRFAGGVARDFSPNSTVTAKGFYKSAEAEDDFVFATGGGGTVNGSVSDYTSYGAEVGLRQYLGARRGQGLRPFVGATAGATYIEGIDLTVGAATAELNEGGWVPTASATGGFELPVSPTASLALESGIRWTGEQDRSGLAAAALGDDGAKISVPLTLRGSFRF